MRDAVLRIGARFTLNEALTLQTPLVYGLCGADGKVFYVGKTRKPSERFLKYLPKRRNQLANTLLLKLLNAASDDLRVAVLRSNPHNLEKAEQQEIAKRVRLANLTGNGFRPSSKTKLGRSSSKWLGICPICRAPKRSNRNEKLGGICRPCKALGHRTPPRTVEAA